MSNPIGWCDTTLNPGIYGCQEVSPACAHCYAATMAHRLGAMGVPGYAGTTARRASGVHWTGEVRVDFAAIGPAFAKLPGPRSPKRVFVTSMADLFHAAVPSDFISEVFVEMAARPWHTFQVLTKRPERAAPWFRMVSDLATGGAWTWPDNVWIGTTVEDQARADERIPHLLRVPARVRFLSCEPLLGAVDFRKVPGFNRVGMSLDGWWVIAGGESGPHARPSHPDWFRSLRDQCVAARVAFFFKQHGEYGPGCFRRDIGEAVYREFDTFHLWVNKAPTWLQPDDVCMDTRGRVVRNGAEMTRARDDGAFPVTVVSRVGKHAAGRLLDGVEWSQFPESASPPSVAGAGRDGGAR